MEGFMKSNKKEMKGKYCIPVYSRETRENDSMYQSMSSNQSDKVP